MAVDRREKSGYEELVDKLIETTRAGKLVWRETADKNTFIAAVRGIQTFEIRLVVEPRHEKSLAPFRDTSLQFGLGGALQQDEAVGVVLTSRDAQGEVLFEHVDWNIPSEMFDLYQLARRVATRVDEKIEASLQLLNQL